MAFPLGYGAVWAKQHKGTIPAREVAFPCGIWSMRILQLLYQSCMQEGTVCPCWLTRWYILFWEAALVVNVYLQLLPLPVLLPLHLFFSGQATHRVPFSIATVCVKQNDDLFLRPWKVFFIPLSTRLNWKENIFIFILIIITKLSFHLSWNCY